MKNEKKWKDRLLSSSLPLEYEVAKILTKESLHVTYDFAYQRLDKKEEKEFSIDILANGYYPFNDPYNVGLEVDVLVECKYRNPGVSWAFLPNLEPYLEEKVSFSKGTIKVLDEFSGVRLVNKWDGLHIPHQSNKGVEINILNGEVHDTGIHHGINQLIYSFPVIMARVIKDSLLFHLDDVHPYLFCPILVTTAELRVLNNDFSVLNLKIAETLEDISTVVPYLSYSIDLYPSFISHCKEIFKNIPDDDSVESFNFFNELHAKKITSIDGEPNDDPDEKFYPTEHLLNKLKDGRGGIYFREILICNLEYLPALIDKIKESITRIGGTIEKLT